MQVQDKLNREAVQYEKLRHNPTFTSQTMAHAEHVPGMNVAKPVIVNVDDRYYMCVLGACCHVDFSALKSVLDAKSVRLAHEEEMANLFPDCELGAEPPFGSLYGLPTILDDRMQNDEFIIFQGGTHDKAIQISMQDYLKLERPQISSFSVYV